MPRKAKVLYVPRRLETYEPGSKNKPVTVEHYGQIIYLTPGGPIDVELWVQYPSYDFIFGVPSPHHTLAKDEVGYFEIRFAPHGRKKPKTAGFYLDQGELDHFLKGFTAINRENKRRGRRR